MVIYDDILAGAVQEQRAALAIVAVSTGEDSSQPEIVLPKDEAEPLGLHIQQHIHLENGATGSGAGPDINLSPTENAADLGDGPKVGPSIEHQFIPSFNGHSPLHGNERRCRVESENLSALKSGADEDLGFDLNLGDNEPKRRRSDPLSSSMDEEAK